MNAARPLGVALLTGRAWPQGSVDDAPLVSALAAEGVATRWTSWEDAPLVAAEVDALLVRSCWDYTERCPAFLRALDEAHARGVAVWNSPALVRWNADKRYLLDLALAGVPVPPTLSWDGVDAADLARAVREQGWSDVVLKPRVSSGARRTLRLGVAGLEAGAALHAKESPHAAWLAQPYLDEIARDGEWSLLFFCGAFSHAVRKRPAGGDFRVQERLGGTTRAEPAPPALQRAAAAALAAAPEPALYARVDGIVRDGRFLLMELELIEPALFLVHDDAAAPRFARVIANALPGRRGG